MSRANEAGLRFSPRQLFERQTVAELAEVAGQAVGIETEQGLVRGEVKLTPIQRWFFEQEMERVGHFNQAVMLEVRDLEAEVVKVVVKGIVRHHDVLRMRYERIDGVWRQRNDGGVEEEIFGVADLREFGERERAARLEAEAQRVQESLDLERGPVGRVVWFDMGAGEANRLLLVIHHLVVDGVSWRILLEDLQRGCRQVKGGQRLEFPAKTTSFQKWAEKLEDYAGTESVALELDYWRNSASAERLPVDWEGIEDLVEETGTVREWLNEEETRALLQDVPGKYRTEINDVLLTALAGAFCQWTGQDRLVLDLEGHGREEAAVGGVDLTRTVGWFTTLYPVKLEWKRGLEPESALKSVKEQLRAVPHRGIGYGLLKYVRREPSLRKETAPEVGFNYLGQFDQALETNGWFRGARENSGRTQGGKSKRPHLLEVTGSVMGGRLGMNWVYNRKIHRRETIERLARGYQESLRRLIGHCLRENVGGCTPSDFPLTLLTQEQVDELSVGRELEDIYPLSPLQEGLLFHTLYAPSAGMYLEQFSCDLPARVDLLAFKQAWNKVVNGYETLRSSFVWKGLEKPLQLVHQQLELLWQEEDWRGCSNEEQAKRLAAFLNQDRQKGFDLTKGPLMRCALFRFSDSSCRFVWSCHHLLLDGWSMPLVVKELLRCYEALSQGQEIETQRARPYRDYIAWLQRQDPNQAEQYWRRQLAGFREPNRLAWPRAGTKLEQNSQHTDGLSQELSQQLERFAREHQLTMNTLVQGAWALLVARYSAREDVVFGATVSGRPGELRGVETMVGMFINTLPVRIKVTPELRILEWLKQVQTGQVEMRQYEYSPLVQVQGWSELDGGTPLFESILVFMNYPVNQDELKGLKQESGLQISDMQVIKQINYPLSVEVSAGKAVGWRIYYDGRFFDGATIQRMGGHLKRLLEGMANKPQVRLGELEMMSATERKQLS